MIKEAFATLLISKVDKLSIWIDKLGEENKAEAARLMLKMALFYIPSANKMIDFQISNPCHPVFTEVQEEKDEQPQDGQTAENSPKMSLDLLEQAIEAAKDPDSCNDEEFADFAAAVRSYYPERYAEVEAIMEARNAPHHTHFPPPPMNGAQRPHQ